MKTIFIIFDSGTFSASGSDKNKLNIWKLNLLYLTVELTVQGELKKIS